MKRERLSLFVFIDALGWKIASEHWFLGRELREAKPLATVLGYSSTCDPTILTGVPPREHGHFAFFQYAPERSPFKAMRFLSWVPRWADRARVRTRLSKYVGKLLGFTGYFALYAVPFRRLPFLDYSEKKDLYKPHGILGGQETILDLFKKHGIAIHVSDWRASEEANLRSMRSAIDRGEIEAGYLYLAGLDGVMHREGVHSPAVTQHIRGYEAQIRDLLRLARERYEDVRLHVFSDHGMIDVTSVVDLQRLVEETGLTWGRDFAAVYDSTMARFWFLRDGARKVVEDALGRCRQGHILTDSELEAFGCDFPDRAYGELFFLVNPGVLICPSDMGLHPIKGMHGYDPGHPDSVAMYGCSQLGGVAPHGLIDLYQVMAESVLGPAQEVDRSAA